MGRAKAMEMLCLGKKISSQEAKERNLVAQIYPRQTFQENVQVSEIAFNMVLICRKTITSLVCSKYVNIFLYLSFYTECT